MNPCQCGRRSGRAVAGWKLRTIGIGPEVNFILRAQLVTHSGLIVLVLAIDNQHCNMPVGPTHPPDSNLTNFYDPWGGLRPDSPDEHN